MKDTETDLGNGGVVSVRWGERHADVELTEGDIALTATFSAPEGLDSFAEWCPVAPSQVKLEWSRWVPSGDGQDSRSIGVTSFVWQSTGATLARLVAEWNISHRDAAEVRLRERMAAWARDLPATSARRASGTYYRTLLAMYEYAALRHDHPLRLLSDATGRSSSTLRGQLARARVLAGLPWWETAVEGVDYLRLGDHVEP